MRASSWLSLTTATTPESSQGASATALLGVGLIANAIVLAFLARRFLRDRTVRGPTSGKKGLSEKERDDLLHRLSATEQRAQELEGFLLAAPNAVVVSDERGMIRVVNHRACELFGYSREEFLGRSIDQLVPERYRRSHPENRDLFHAKPTARAMGLGRELFAVRRDGSEFPVEIGLAPVITHEGRQALAAIVDISFRKKSEVEMLALNEALVKKTQELEQFIYTVSHDLKAPLISIAGFSERLAARLGENPESDRRMLERISVNAESMHRLLEDLLQLSRVVHRPLSAERCDVKSASLEVLQAITVLTQSHRATVVLTDPLGEVFMEPQHLRQVLQNLIGNAIVHSAPERDPIVTISARDAEAIPGRPEGQKFLELLVSDNGPGIAKQHFQRIFQLFERLDGTKKSGTGVGLAIVKAISDRYGGQVDVTSEIGTGSTFKLLLPKA